MADPQSDRLRNHPRPTLRDVARVAEVSPATVSKVLNEHPDISPQTRRHIQKVLREMHYVRREQRRPAPPKSIAVMGDHLNTAYATEIMRGVMLAAERLDVDVMVSRFHRSTDDDNLAEPGAWAKRLAAAGRSGAIVLTAELSSEHLAALSQEHLPVVAIDPIGLEDDGVPSVGSTNFAGGYAATEHLISLGHTRIAAMGGRPGSIAAIARLHGFRSACASAGITVDENLVTFASFDYRDGVGIGSEWLALDDPPTAILAASDPAAIGIVEAARQLGISVPNDLSIVGYDDTYLAAWASPPLTTVRQPLSDMGNMAVRTIMDMINDVPPTSHHLELATDLVVRETTAPPQQKRKNV